MLAIAHLVADIIGRCPRAHVTGTPCPECLNRGIAAAVAATYEDAAKRARLAAGSSSPLSAELERHAEEWRGRT